MKTTLRLSGYHLAIVFGLCASVLAACQQMAVAIDINKQNYLDAVPAGTVIRLQQELVVPANSARVYFQQGAQTRLSTIDKYQAWCEFEIKTLATTPQTIHPDSFVIQKLVNERAGFIDGAGIGSMANTLEEFSTILYLQSASQPDVLRLSCVRRRGNRIQTYLKLSDVQSALGAILTFNIN